MSPNTQEFVRNKVPPAANPFDAQEPIKEASWLRRHYVGMLILVIAFGGVYAVSQIPKKSDDLKVLPIPAVTVTLQRIDPITSASTPELAQQLRDTFDVPAVVAPNRIVPVSAEVAARVEQLPREKGQSVKAGELLVELNTDLLKADVDRVTAQSQFAGNELKRVRELKDKGAATQNEVDNLKTVQDVSLAELKSAQAKLDRAKIFAPVDGLLDDRPVEKGQYVSPGNLVARIVDTSIVKVMVDVPERDIAYFRIGQEQEILFSKGDISSGLQDRKVGKITYVGALANEQTHTTRIEVSIPNPDGQLRSGQMVTARLTRQILDQLIVIPLEAVIPLEEGKVVYVAQNDVAQQRTIQLGTIKGSGVQVLSGLNKGDRLIVSGQRYVTTGQKIHEDPSPAAPAPNEPAVVVGSAKEGNK